MNKKFRTRMVIGDRPAVHPVDGYEIPSDWLIFNAPRPLDASELRVIERPAMTIGEFDYPEVKKSVWPCWQGDFVSGIFYAAVDPDDARTIKENVDLSAVLLDYVAPDEWRKRVEAHRDRLVAEYGLTAEQVAELEFQDVEQSYRSYLERGDRE